MRRTEERSLEKLRKNLNAETKCENYKRNKSSIHGITLIALVITIIVLLILAGVTISTLTGENGILTKATSSKESTTQGNANDRIKLISNEWLIEKNTGTRDIETFLEDKVISNEIDSWTDNQDGTYDIEVDGYYGTINEDGKVIEQAQKIVERTGLNVGDYINYTPDENTTGYSKDKLTSTYTGSSDNSSDLTQDTLKWQILRIYKNGRMDLIGSTTNQNVYFQRATGYNNGVTVMNDICKELYSKNTKGITARSVKLEDMESWLTESGKTARGNYSAYTDGPKYGHTQTYVTNRYYPNLYAQAIGGKIDSGAIEGIDVEEGNKTGLTESQEGTASGSTQASTNITVTQTYYDIPINSTNYGDGAKALSSGTSYWVSSRSARCNSSHACFGLRSASTYMSCISMFNSNGYTGYCYYRLRPVVSLGSEVQVETCSGTNSTTNMHTITQY